MTADALAIVPGARIPAAGFGIVAALSARLSLVGLVALLTLVVFSPTQQLKA